LDLEETGGPNAPKGFGRPAFRSTPAGAETAGWRVVLERGCSGHPLRMRLRNEWLQRGVDSLRVGFSPGRPRGLTRSQERRLLRILLKGAIANGYATELWTT